jgi:hypothetical protein
VITVTDCRPLVIPLAGAPTVVVPESKMTTSLDDMQSAAALRIHTFPSAASFPSNAGGVLVCFKSSNRSSMGPNGGPGCPESIQIPPGGDPKRRKVSTMSLTAICPFCSSKSRAFRRRCSGREAGGFIGFRTRCDLKSRGYGASIRSWVKVTVSCIPCFTVCCPLF